MEITKDMNIYNVVRAYPELVRVFMDFGIGCFGCAVAKFESIEIGAMAHGIDPDNLVEALNKELKKKDVFHIDRVKWRELKKD
jgi:hybrid cluster-associated redox disulfide protein